MINKSASKIRLLAWMTALGVTAASVLSTSVYAEDLSSDITEFSTESESEVSSAFTITAFPDFVKNSEGVFEKNDIQERYGHLTADSGTSQQDFGLPDELDIVGYFGESSDITETYTLKDISWKLKSDTGEYYSEESPAGEYTFVPDLDDYVLSQDWESEIFFESLSLADGVKLPELKVTISEPESETAAPTEASTESETAAQTEPVYTTESETVAQTEPVYTTESTPETEPVYITESNSETEPVYTTESNSEAETVYTTESETETVYIPETETYSEQDFINGTDDSLINADSDAVFVNDEPSQIPSESEPISESESQSESQPISESESEPSTEPQPASENQQPETYLQSEPETQSESEMQSESESQPETYLQTEAADLSVTISIRDAAGNTADYTDSATNNTIALKANPGENDNTVSILLPCNSAMNMADIAVTFADPSKSLIYPFVPSPENPQDFQTESTKTFTYYVDGTSDGVQYTVKLTVLKNEHAWGAAATCTEAQICTVCGAENPNEPATGHSLTEATCTKPATCVDCGWTDGVLLPHTWMEATCTEPETCEVCGATRGKKLGHDLSDWEVIEYSTQTEHGTAERFCQRESCDYYEEKALNIIGDPANNLINNITEGATYKLKETLTFSATGAAMGNTQPINGDVRYVPYSWKVQNTPGTFRDNFTGSFAITVAGSYTLTVTFQKQIYDNGWQVTDIADSKSVTFQVGQLIQGQPVEGTENGIRINPATGDTTRIAVFVAALAAAVIAIAAAIIFKRRKSK